MRRSLVCLVGAASLAGVAFTQPKDTRPAFEMADVHPSTVAPPPLGNATKVPFAGNGRYEIKGATMLDLIAIAYGLDPEKIRGGPTWLEWDRFDVNAKMPLGAPPDEQRLMLQELLADRFALVIHNDSMPLRAYALTVGKSPKLRQSDGAGDTGCRTSPQGMSDGGVGVRAASGAGGIAGGVMAVSCRRMTMEAFAQFLRGPVSQFTDNSLIVDKTEMKGEWDFEYKTSLRDAITVMDALDKQLGLKLMPSQVALPVTVVNSVNEKPSANLPGVVDRLAVKRSLTFEVASVKPSDPEFRGMVRPEIKPGGGLTMRGASLRLLIIDAYGVTRAGTLVNAPSLDQALMTRYDVIAKAPAVEPASVAVAPADRAVGSPEDKDAAMQMLRALLADRFKLVTHWEERPLPAYKLIAVKPKLKRADPAERTSAAEGPGADGKDLRTTNPSLSRLVVFQNTTMTQFVEEMEGISAYLNGPVVDGTGLAGAWDFSLNFSPVNLTWNRGRGGAGNGVASDPDGTLTLFEAVEQQLGLKLVEEKRPAPVLVIDHVESKPTDN